MCDQFLYFFSFQISHKKIILHGMHDFSQHLHYVTTGQNTQGVVIEGHTNKHTDGMQLHRMQLN